MSGQRGAGRYARGDNAIGHCERCSKKMLLRHMVYDGQYPDLRVCPECWDPKHPQESLPDTFDPVTLYDPTGDQDRATNITTISLNQIAQNAQRSVGEESAVPVYSLPLFQNAFTETERLVTNPMQINAQVNVSRYQLKANQDPATLDFNPDIETQPDPSGNVLVVTYSSSLEKPLCFFSNNDITSWLETDFDTNLGATQVGLIRAVAWCGSPYNRWVALGYEVGAVNSALWTCEDDVFTASSVWTERTLAFEWPVQTSSLEYANGVVIAVGQARTGPTRLGIQRSTDGGITWGDVSPTNSIGNGLNGARYRKNNEWWVHGGNGELARSLDNGATWITTGFGLPGGGANIYRMEFTDLTTGGDRQRIHVWCNDGWHTSDNDGATWTARTGAIDTEAGFKVNPNTGTLIKVNTGGKVHRSTDNGVSYTEVAIGQMTAQTKMVSLIYQDNASPYGFVACGYNTTSGKVAIWTSVDDGLNWVERVNNHAFSITGCYGIASADEYTHDKGKEFGVGL